MGSALTTSAGAEKTQQKKKKKKNAHVYTKSRETQKRRCANEFCVIQKSRRRDHALVLLQERTKAVLGLLRCAGLL